MNQWIPMMDEHSGEVAKDNVLLKLREGCWEWLTTAQRRLNLAQYRGPEGSIWPIWIALSGQ